MRQSEIIKAVDSHVNFYLFYPIFLRKFIKEFTIYKDKIVNS